MKNYAIKMRFFPKKITASIFHRNISREKICKLFNHCKIICNILFEQATQTVLGIQNHKFSSKMKNSKFQHIFTEIRSISGTPRNLVMITGFNQKSN